MGYGRYGAPPMTGIQITILVFVLIIIVIVFTPSIIGYLKLKSAFDQTAQVIVVEKRVGRSTGNGSGRTQTVIFELPDGSKKGFQVNKELFNTVYENDTGILTYKEVKRGLFPITQFVNFEKD